MPIRSITKLYDQSDPPIEIGVRLDGVSKAGFLEILYADIPGNSWNANRLAKFAARAQELIDYRIPLTDPSLVDDPAGPNGSDPARPGFFWDNGDLVSRSVVISDVVFDGQQLSFRLTKVR